MHLELRIQHLTPPQFLAVILELQDWLGLWGSTHLGVDGTSSCPAGNLLGTKVHQLEIRLQVPQPAQHLHGVSHEHQGHVNRAASLGALKMLAPSSRAL